MAYTITLIRHAEKGHENVHLSETGKLRAEYLVDYFGYDILNICGRFHKVFAQRQHHKDTSDRSVETVEPTCRFTGIDLDDSFTKREIHGLAKSVESEDGCVLICWEHEQLPKIAQLLGLPSGLNWNLNPYSKKDEDQFDITWVIDRVSGHWRLRTFRQFDIEHGIKTWRSRAEEEMFSCMFS